MQRYDEIKTVVVDELKRISTNSSIDLDSANLADLKMKSLMIDSLETIQLGLTIEDRLGVKMEITELPQEASVYEFIEFISLCPPKS